MFSFIYIFLLLFNIAVWKETYLSTSIYFQQFNRFLTTILKYCYIHISIKFRYDWPINSFLFFFSSSHFFTNWSLHNYLYNYLYKDIYWKIIVSNYFSFWRNKLKYSWNIWTIIIKRRDSNLEIKSLIMEIHVSLIYLSDII